MRLTGTFLARALIDLAQNADEAAGGVVAERGFRVIGWDGAVVRSQERALADELVEAFGEGIEDLDLEGEVDGAADHRLQAQHHLRRGDDGVDAEPGRGAVRLEPLDLDAEDVGRGEQVPLALLAR